MDETSLTKRHTVEKLENILFKEMPVLDKGFIRLVDYMGNDDSIVQAARVSYGKGTKTQNDDTALIRYLMRHKHTTPFEMCEIKFHVKTPIFIARQWLRHRSASVNEYSARYSIMEEDYYIPSTDQIRQQSKSNKQGRGEVLESTLNVRVKQSLEDISQSSFKQYNQLLNEDVNLAKEISRIILPLNVYTQFYWKIDLHNLLHFLRLRVDSHAQYEIREYASAMLNIVKDWVPVTYQAFLDYHVHSKIFTSDEINVIKNIIKGKKGLENQSKISKRELKELVDSFEIEDELL